MKIKSWATRIKTAALVIALGLPALYLGTRFIEQEKAKTNRGQVQREVEEGELALKLGDNSAQSRTNVVGVDSSPQPNLLDTYLPYARDLAKYEGKPRFQVYDPIPNDGRDEPTIGTGHLMGNERSRKAWKIALPEIKPEEYDDYLHGKKSLTPEQCERLFAYDIHEKVDDLRIKTDEHDVVFINNFDSYPEYLRKAFTNAYFRGDLGPKTRALVNQANEQKDVSEKAKYIRKAAEEYLNNNEYVHAVERGRAGIIPRMNANRDAMLQYADELKSKK